MAHSHYVIDFYFPSSDGAAGLRREAMRIVADNDAEAIAEGERIDAWKKSSSYQIRSITNSARSGDRLIYSSQPAESTPAEA